MAWFLAGKVLIHEATMENDRQELAVGKRHSTAAEAMADGLAMRAERTVLTHFSQRYPKLSPWMDMKAAAAAARTSFSESQESRFSGAVEPYLLAGLSPGSARIPVYENLTGFEDAAVGGRVDPYSPYIINGFDIGVISAEANKQQDLLAQKLPLSTAFVGVIP